MSTIINNTEEQKEFNSIKQLKEVIKDAKTQKDNIIEGLEFYDEMMEIKQSIKELQKSLKEFNKRVKENESVKEIEDTIKGLKDQVKGREERIAQILVNKRVSNDTFMIFDTDNSGKNIKIIVEGLTPKLKKEKIEE